MNKLKAAAAGFHVSEPALTNGIGAYFDAMLANGQAVLSKGNETAGVVYTLQEKARKYPGSLAIGVYRKSHFPNFGNTADDVPIYGADPVAMAKLYWDEVDRTWPAELDKNWVWVEFPNEVDKNRSAWLGQLLFYLGGEAINRGYKYLGPGWSAGEPEISDWDHFAGYLQLCQVHPDRLGISLHEYSYDMAGPLVDKTPWLMGRVSQLNGWCAINNIVPPLVIISELGWSYNDAPPAKEGVGQLKDMMLWYLKHAPNVMGWALWALDKDDKYASLAKKINPYMAPLAAMINNTDWPDPSTITNPNPEGTKRVVYDTPNIHEMDLATYLKIAELAYLDYGRSMVSSAEDAGDIVTSAGADKEKSEVVVFMPDEKSQAEAIQYFEEKGIKYSVARLFVDDSLGLKFRPVQSKTVTQPFGANPNYYAQYGLPGHEGIDFRSPLGDRYHAVADGKVVWASNLNGNGRESAYGWHVVIEHTSPTFKKFRTFYAHCAPSLPVKTGQNVAAGDVVGISGNTGISSGPHLHFGIAVDGDTGNGYPIWRFGQFIDPAVHLADLPAPPSVIPHHDMHPYFYPPAGNYGDIYILSNNWGQGPERCQLQMWNNASYIVKNQSFEKRMIDSLKVWFLVDTSPGNGKYYTVDSIDGWMPRYWSPNGEHVRHEAVKWFNLDDCKPTGEQSNWSSVIRFAFFHQSWQSDFNILEKDVIEMHWIYQGAIEEKYFYAKGLGLVHWENKAGKVSSISDVITLGNQGNNVIKYPQCFTRV